MKLVDFILKLYPREFRESHRSEIEAFIESDRTRIGSGRAARAVWRFGIALDLVVGALRVRRHPGAPAPALPSRLPSSFDRMGKDARHTFRALAAAPLVSAVIVLTLAVAIGMSAAIFSVVRNVLFEPLAYRSPEQLVQIQARWVNDGVDDANHSGTDFKRIREKSVTLSDVAAVRNIRQNLTGLELPRQVEVGWTSENLFEILGVRPALGPGFTTDSPPGTLMLGHELWLDAFGADREVVGRVVRLDGHPYTVSGVLPRGFTLWLPGFPSRVDVWKVPDDWWQNGDIWNGDSAEMALFDLVGRLGEGRTIEQARAEMRAFAERFRGESPDFARSGGEYDVVPLLDAVVGDVSPYLYTLLGAVGLVLLVACANVMNLTLARARTREREMALRLALGSSRAAIARMLLAESLVLALSGAAAGLGLAWLATDALKRLRPAELPRLEEVGLDPTLLAFALGVTLAATVAFGVLPALASSRESDGRFLTGSRVEGGSRSRGGRVLVAIQIAVSLVLWIGAGLLGESMHRLASVDPGFAYENLLTFSVSLPGSQYARPTETDRFFRELEAGIESLPGVRSAGTAWPLPLSRRVWSNTYTAGAVRELDRAYAHYRVVTPGFFETLALDLLDGRPFSGGDARHVAVVNEALAKRAFVEGGGGTDRSPIGRTILANPWGGGAEAFEIVGVVADVRDQDLREPARDTIYFDSRGWSWTDWELDVVVDTGSLPPEALVLPIRELMASMDPTIPMSRVRPMEDYVDDYLAENRFALWLIGSFAGVTGLLATVGLYGVVSHTVARRAKEIGIRMAVGADRRRILEWVYRDSLSLVAVGIGAGLLAALGLTRYLASFLFEVPTTDGLTFASTAAALAAVAALACYAPAHRATALDPVRVLKSD